MARRYFAGALFAMALLIPGAANAAAPTTQATLDGEKVFNLAAGWGEAESCAVYAAGDIRCFTDHDDLDQAVGYTRDADPQIRRLTARSATAAEIAAVPSCGSGWFCIYENTNGGGRRLQFRDEAWQSLGQYSFADKTSSFRNNQGSSDTAGLSSGLTGAGWTLIIGAGSTSNNLVSTYNDQADRVLG